MDTITYEHHIWSNGAAYINLEDGSTSRIRVKKLLDGNEIKNLDHDMPLSELEAMTDSQLQEIVDRLIDLDEIQDAAQIARETVTVKQQDQTLNARLTGLNLKARLGATTQRDKDRKNERE